MSAAERQRRHRQSANYKLKQRGLVAVNDNRAAVVVVRRIVKRRIRAPGRPTSFSDALLERAIQMRQSRQTWKGIARVLRRNRSSLQQAIWRHLIKRDLLNKQWVTSIWDPPVRDRYRVGAEPAWQHLINKTGRAPTP